MKTGYRIFTLTSAICLLSRAMATDVSIQAWPFLTLVGGLCVGLFASSLEDRR